MKVNRVLKGGSYFDEPWELTSTDRTRSSPAIQFGFEGFRLVVRRKS